MKNYIYIKLYTLQNIFIISQKIKYIVISLKTNLLNQRKLKDDSHFNLKSED